MNCKPLSGLHILAGALLALGAAACTLGPDFSRPAPPGPLPQPPAAGPQSFLFGADIAHDWYRLFKSAALDSLVQQALAGNPDLDAARHGLAAAQFELRAVAGSALPQVQGSADVSRSRLNGSFVNGPVAALGATANRFSVGPALAYDLDAFGGVRRAIESQSAAAAVTRDQALNTFITLVDQVVVTAFDYASTEAQLDITRSLVSDLQAQLQLNQRLEAAGKITHGDTLLAQAQLENTRADLPQLEQRRDTLRDAIAQLLGREPAGFSMPELGLADFQLPPQLPVSLPASLVRQRPDVLQAEDTLHEASAQIGVAEAARWPSLTISAQYAQQATKLNELLTQPGAIWEAGLGLSTPIFNGGRLKARRDEARAKFLQAQSSYRAAVLAALVEVADCIQAIQHDAAAYTARSRALQASRDSRDLAVAQFKSGTVGELTVLAAEAQYQSAALAQVQSDMRRFSDTAALFHALGGGWWNAQADPATQPAPAAAQTAVAGATQ
ncbi:MAG: efflux transporter outer membrane subunit [Nevskia sp.]|nr:efflux transporter outer membrane subunit [Nevskia sp.]